ncbi:HAMP domain-containing sensor histidine kinase [Marivirga harenae]|uniref:sensor histidine kinase n=1 Tax=Marivirga harenae TaxID=2010992 RepID=UPI0026DEF2D5|nr:HAMP domain-containing sensor histidine kinase [Marivirga harenae]WKV10877.1 HAMP domain-containing sensor histidine kinase [Marivirga harenae]
MENSFTAFKDFFESANNPMFIIDLDSHQLLNVNRQFVNEQYSSQHALSLFESKLRECNGSRSFSVKQDEKIILFNIVFEKEKKALVQILESEPEPAQENSGSIPSKHPFDEIASNKSFINRLPCGIIHTNKNFEALWFNDKLEKLFGREIEEQFNFIDAIYVKNISQFWEKIEKLNSGEEQVKFSFVIHNVKKSSEVFINATAMAVGKDQQLQDGFVFILEDKTENMHFSEEITKQNLALNQINHELDKFLYSVSHNIRGPIASLEGLLKVIEISDVNTVNELQHHLRLNLRLLNGFVSDINNVATNIHTHVNYEEVNLRDILEQTVLFVDDIYEIKPNINFEIPASYSIKTDSNRFGMVIKSLLKNSFQYRDSRKDDFRIDFKVKQNEDFHLIEIIDNGIGIPDKVMPYVFDMFYRGTELSSGNGMGLYNSREILKKIGGTMNIESKDREWTKVKIYVPMHV